MGQERWRWAGGVALLGLLTAQAAAQHEHVEQGAAGAPAQPAAPGGMEHTAMAGLHHGGMSPGEMLDRMTSPDGCGAGLLTHPLI